MLAIRTADPGEAFVQIPALEKGCDRAVNDGPPEAVFGLE